MASVALEQSARGGPVEMKGERDRALGWQDPAAEEYNFFNCGKVCINIHKLKCATPAFFKSSIQWHEVHSHCWATIPTIHLPCSLTFPNKTPSSLSSNSSPRSPPPSLRSFILS